MADSNNTPSTERFTEGWRIPRAIRGQQIVFRTRAAVFCSVSESSLRLVRPRRYPFSPRDYYLCSFSSPPVCYLSTWTKVKRLSLSLPVLRIDRDRCSIEYRRCSSRRWSSFWKTVLDGDGSRKKEGAVKKEKTVNGIWRSNKESSRVLLEGSIGWKSGCFTDTAKYQKLSRAQAE